MSHADDHRDHPGPHPAIAARNRYLGGGQPEEFGGNAAVAAPGYPYPPGWLYPGVPDWRHPGPRYLAQADLDPALAPGMTDLMVDPETLDAFMAANPLPDDLPPVEDVDWPEAEGNE